jgi:trehalose 2-sulfotransferase
MHPFTGRRPKGKGLATPTDLRLAGSMPTPIRADSYLVSATPRTGSTLLCGLLAATGVAGKPESYFRLPDERSSAERWGVQVSPGGPLDYGGYVRAAMAVGSTANGVFGARVMWGTICEVIGKLRAAYGHPLGSDVEVLEQVLGQTRFVHLQRGDVVAQAVSWARAEQSSYWQDGDKVPPGWRPRFDFNEVDGYVKAITEHNAAWHGWFDASGIVPLRVLYEDVVADMAGATNAILQFLGLDLPSGHVITAGTRRQADEINEEWARRYCSLRHFGP